MLCFDEKLRKKKLYLNTQWHVTPQEGVIAGFGPAHFQEEFGVLRGSSVIIFF